MYNEEDKGFRNNIAALEWAKHTKEVAWVVR